MKSFDTEPLIKSELESSTGRNFFVMSPLLLEAHAATALQKTNTKETSANGAPATYVITCVSPIPAGTTKYNEQLNVTYIISESGIDHNNQGKLTTKIE